MTDMPLVTARLTRQLGKGAEELAAQRREARPRWGRIGSAWDIAHAFVFPASDEAGYITTTKLVMDGRMTASG